MNEEKKSRYAKVVADLYERISSDVSTLKIEAYKSKEPLKFSERFEGQYAKLGESQKWAEKLFDCAWFKFDVEIPEGVDGLLALKIDINGELFIADENGEPLEGLTCKSSTFCESLGKPVKRFFMLSDSQKKSKKFSVWADCAFNDLFGRAQGDGKIACARLSKINSDIWDLYYNYEHVFDWLFAIDENSKNYAKLEKALENATLLIESDLKKNLNVANSVLKDVLFKESERPQLKVYAIGHAHMDLAWLWPIRETKRKLARTFATALSNVKKYPDYVFGASQPQGYEWIKEDYPSLYSRIKNAVRDGAIDPLGAMWVEPDCNLPSGESFIRQIIYGKKFFKDEFQKEPNYFWIPDSFGYSPQLPQILLKSGLKYFVTQKLSWNMINRFPYHSFWWQGIDSSKVLAHMLPEETYNSPAAPRSLIKIENEYAQKNVSDCALMAFGIGDGGGGPGVEHLERIKKNKFVNALPEIRNKKVSEFLSEFEKQSENFPTWKGDLYLEKHQGTFTTQGLNKRYNRLCEMLLREVEFFMYLVEMSCNQKPDKTSLDEIWKEVLLYQFHDILPGSSIERVYQESCKRYEILVENLNELKSECLKKLRGVFGADAVFNSTSWNVKIPVSDSILNVLQLGFAAKSAKLKIDDPHLKNSNLNLLENNFLRVEFDENGAITSIVEKSTKRDFVCKKSPANIFKIYEDNGDAWDFGYDYRNNESSAAKLVSSKFVGSDSAPKLVFEFAFKNSKIVETIYLQEDEIKLDIDTDWHDENKMLRLVFDLNFEAKKSVSEVAFGSYERNADDSTIWSKARIETPAHQWVAMKSEDCAFAILNNGKYGWRLKNNSIECAILRAVPRPGEALVAASDSCCGNNSKDFADIGKQSFKLSLLCLKNGLDKSFVSSKARALNTDFDIPNASAQTAKNAFSFIEISNPNIELVAMKPALYSDSWIARFVNLSDFESTSNIQFHFKPKSIEQVDLAENFEKKCDNLNGISFKPFEIKSFRIS